MISEDAKIKDEKKLTDLVESGFFKDSYIIYTRKSTDDTENQKNSIRYQKAMNIRYAFDKKFPVAKLTIDGFCRDGIISERHSAFKEDEMMEIKDGRVLFKIERPKFQRLAEYLNKKYFKGVIFLCWDRASRNKADSLVMDKLTKNGCDLQFTLTSYDKNSSGELHKDIDGVMSNHHSRTTSEKVSLAQKNSRSMGICTYKAPVGYLNVGTMSQKPIDTVRGPIIKQMFELYATGEWSLHALAKWATDQGFTMPPVRRRRTQDEILSEEDDDIRLELNPVERKIEYKSISRILKNRFYLGEIIGNEVGEYIKSISHEALINKETFDKVQFMLNKKKVSEHYSESLDTPYRGMVRCLECGRVYTPYIKKDKYTYLGSRCVSGCSNTDRNINSSRLENKVGDLIKNLSFTDDEKAEIDARIKTDIAILEMKRSKELAQIERRKKKLREDLAYLRSNKLTLLSGSVYSPQEYLIEEEKHNKELNFLIAQEVNSDSKMSDVVKDAIKLSELLKDAYFYYSNANPREKEEIVRVIFSELSYSQNGLKYKCKNGFVALSSRFETICDLTENRTPINGLRTRCPNR